jgi:hypothetical protein
MIRSSIDKSSTNHHQTINKAMTSKTLIKAALTLLTTASLLLSARADITTGLVGYWKLAEGPGHSTVADSSGYVNTGTLTNFTDATYNNMWTTIVDPTNVYADALQFTNGGPAFGTNTCVIVPNSTSLNTPVSTVGYTVAAWVYPTVAGSAQTNNAGICAKGLLNAEEYALYVSGGNFVGIYHNSGNSATYTVASSGVTITPNTWYHVVYAFGRVAGGVYIYPNNSAEAIFINGQLNNTSMGGQTRTTVSSDSYPVTIGDRPNASGVLNMPFQGIIDDVRVYNRPLTTGDIYQLYTNTLAGAPVITTAIRGVTNYVGDTAVFTVGINTGLTVQTGLTYYWTTNGTPDTAVTGPSLTLTNVQLGNAGTISVTISNALGTVTENATLAVNPLPAADYASSLVGWWKFDDGSTSQTAADSVNGNTGALAGFTDGTYTSMWTNGIYRGGVQQGALAFNLDGSAADTVAVPGENGAGPAALDFDANGSSGSPVFTLAAWVNGSATQTNGGAIVAKGYSGGGDQYVLDINGGYYRFYVNDANGVTYTCQSSLAPNPAVWHHLVAVLNGTNGDMALYTNGALAAVSVAPSSLFVSAQDVDFGNHQSSLGGSYNLPLTGNLDDVRIYARALTSADVAALYQSETPPISIVMPAAMYLVTNINAFISGTAYGGPSPSAYTYHWQYNGANIGGATTNTLALNNVTAATGGAYSLIVSNGVLVAPATNSCVVSIVPSVTFNTNGTTWTAQGLIPSYIWLGNNALELTENLSVGGEDNSAFYSFPVYAGNFQASFLYQQVSGGSGADGVTFCIQNDPRGASALGGGGGSLGYGPNTPGPITNSAAFEINIYTTYTKGVGLGTNGSIPSVFVPLGGINPGSGDVISNSLSYDGVTLSVQMTDLNTSATGSTNYIVNIPGLLGSTNGYVGVTGADGGVKALQVVSNFTYVPIHNAPPAPLAIAGLPDSVAIMTNGTITFHATVSGGLPAYYSYQWQTNGVNVAGATTNTYGLTNVSLALTTTNVTLIVSDAGVVSPATDSIPVMVVTNVTFNSFNGHGMSWTSQGDSINWPQDNEVELTRSQGNEANSVFYMFPVNVGQFEASFIYQVQSTFTTSDGITFCLQNDPRGASALGGSGTNLGYGPFGSGITNSVALEININSSSPGGVGVWIATNGYIPNGVSANFASVSPVVLNNQDVVSMHVAYDGTTLTWELTDLNNNETFTTSKVLNITNILGSKQGYVGFTGSDSANPVKATQVVSNFLYVAGAPALIVTSLPAQIDAVAGVNVPLSVTAFGGTPPLTYQWQANGVNIPGATTNSLTLTNVSAAQSNYTYSVIVFDGGFVPPVTNSTVLNVVPVLTFNPSGVGWSAQGTAAASAMWAADNELELTFGTGSEGNSAFYDYPVYVGAFQATFTYQVVSPFGTLADGATFCIQNDPRGAQALGSGGDSLGYGPSGGITNSVAFEMNIYSLSAGGVGVCFGTNGTIGPYGPTTPIDITSGVLITNEVTYDGTTLTVTMTDGVNTFTTNAVGSIPAILGSSLGYVGFTGGDGGDKSVQAIGDFTFVPMAALTVSQSNQTLVISWPTGVGGYVLQQSPSLSAPAWTNVTNAVNVVGGQNQVVVPVSGSALFFQLLLQ